MRNIFERLDGPLHRLGNLWQLGMDRLRDFRVLPVHSRDHLQWRHGVQVHGGLVPGFGGHSVQIQIQCAFSFRLQTRVFPFVPALPSVKVRGRPKASGGLLCIYPNKHIFLRQLFRQYAAHCFTGWRVFLHFSHFGETFLLFVVEIINSAHKIQKKFDFFP